MRTFKPRMSAWILLLAICSPLIALGATVLILNPSEWSYAFAIISGSIAVVCFNATARLLISDEDIKLTRYGRVVWSTPRFGTQMREGHAGDIPFVPAHVLWRGDLQVGYILKGWFDDETVAELRKALAS